MLRWKEESCGETALLVEGARRVGKSTVVEMFAKKEYDSYVIFDFANISQNELDLFKYISDLDNFFMRLRLLKNVNLKERKTVIVFDEVQNYPIARQAIKYLVKDGRYDYIETGSLISIRQNVQNIVIPSEEESISMYPMDYEEFRWALGDTETSGILREMFQKRQSLSDGVNRKMMQDFRLYMLVGGMPQAVSKYLQSKDLAKVDKVKRSILSLYEQDFQKLDTTGKAKALFKAIPSQLHDNSTRFQVTKVLEKGKQSTITNIIDMMEDSKTVNVAYHCDDPHVGMELTSNKSSYKMYLSDTGLFVTLAFWDKDFTENVIYQKLLSDTLDANLGYVYENIVAQMLTALGDNLHYYTWPGQSNHNYEIDFLISRGFKLCPIEVKSSGYNTHKSLDEFCKKYSSRVSNRYLVYTKDLRKDAETLMIPVYMVPFL